MAEQSDESIRSTGATVRRRGLIAGAAALAAALLVRREEQPAAAHDPQDIGMNNIVNTETSGTLLTYAGPVISSGAALNVTDGGATSSFTAMVAGTAAGGKALYGVYGEGSTGVRGLSATGNGVYGTSYGASAVYGGLFAPPGSGYAGVRADGNGTGTYGVRGDNSFAGYGVYGRNDYAGGTGVRGDSSGGFPVVGVVTGGTNINAGVLGVGTLGPGVQGQSYAGHGLVGTTAATDGQHAALIGSVQPGGNAVGLRGSVQAGATGYAGVFDGDVTIHGALQVFGSPKNAAVKHPDNSYRLLYCEESPESWFADYGRGTLVNGRAEIKLDPDFAALVHADDYHVFLTEYGDHSSLYVASVSPTGFTVAAKDGTTPSGTKAPTKAGAGTFSWRVVAKRKDIAGERLAKVAPPPALKPVAPFAIAEAPDIKPPTKKP